VTYGASSDGPALPHGWVSGSLAEIAQMNPPRDPRAFSDSTQVNFVPMRAVDTEGKGVIGPETRAYGDVKKGYTSFLSGDVIMAKITPCMENGKTAVVPELPGSVCFGSTEFHVVRPAPGVIPNWIANFLLQDEVRRAAQRAMTGAVGQMRVPASFLETISIPIAPADEQRRITDALDELTSDLDAGVAALERVRSKLTQYRASLLKTAVDGTLSAEWRQKHPPTEPGTQLLKRILDERRRLWEKQQLRKFREKGQELPKNWTVMYKEPIAPDTASLPPLPQGWCWSTLDQLADIAGGVTKGQKFSPNDETRLVPYLRVANVQRGYLDLSQIKNIRATEEDIEALTLRLGDVLFTEGGDRDKLGRGWIWEGKLPECVHQNHVFRARLVPGVVQPKLVSWCGNSYGRRWFMRVGKQSVNLASINRTNLRSFPVALAPVAEQEVIVESVEDHISIIDHLETDIAAKLKSAQRLRQAVLRHAFSGQLVPQDPSDEPASELLSRIGADREERSREAAAAKRTAKQATKSRPSAQSCAAKRPAATRGH